MNNPNIEHLRSRISPIREQIIQHPVYGSITELEHVRIFMEHHIYAVWDFMSLLKSLQNHLTCTQVPWVPNGTPSVRYLINEIVTGEESDVDQNGDRKSHFELYLEAMRQSEAKTNGISRLVELIKNNVPVEDAIQKAELPESVRRFLQFTFEVITSEKPHIIAAVFTFGREDLIPNMFHSIVGELHQRFPGQLDIFNYYLERHIEVDGEHHGQLALEMVTELCGNDPRKWEEAAQYSEIALLMRKELWDDVYKEITLPVSTN